MRKARAGRGRPLTHVRISYYEPGIQHGIPGILLFFFYSFQLITSSISQMRKLRFREDLIYPVRDRIKYNSHVYLTPKYRTIILPQRTMETRKSCANTGSYY